MPCLSGRRGAELVEEEGAGRDKPWLQVLVPVMTGSGSSDVQLTSDVGVESLRESLGRVDAAVSETARRIQGDGRGAGGERKGKDKDMVDKR